MKREIISHNITADSAWRVRSYSAGAVILTNRNLREDRDGRADAQIRIELAVPRDAFGWRSALLRTDADCAGSIRLNNRPPFQNPDAIKVGLTVFRGQNLTGPSADQPIGDSILTDPQIVSAVQEVCRFAIAEKLESRKVRNEAPVLQRDVASLEAWVRTVADLEGWRNPRVTNLSVSFLEDRFTARDDKVLIRVRGEFIDPLLGASLSRADEATRLLPGGHMPIMPAGGRPIWIRSYVAEYEVDCRANTVRQGERIDYVEHDLKNVADRARPWTRFSQLTPAHYDYPHLQAACRRIGLSLG